VRGLFPEHPRCASPFIGGLFSFEDLSRGIEMAKQKGTISDQLRRAIRESGRSQNQISKATNGRVSRFSLCRFLKGDGLSLASVDELGRVLGLEVKAPA
jgi:hypothetical protein